MKKILLSLCVATLAFSGMQVSAGYFNPAPIEVCGMRINRDLGVGSQDTSSNYEVTYLQKMLVRLGYLHTNPNGYYGYATKAAVVAFQRDEQVVTTGRVRGHTRNLINERMCDTSINNVHDQYAYQSGVPTGYTNAGQSYNASYVTLPTVSFAPATTYPQQAMYASVPIAPVSNWSNTGTCVYGFFGACTPTVQGTLQVTTPLSGTSYREGDTLSVAYAVQGVTRTAPFTLTLTNRDSRESITLLTTDQSYAQIVLTKEILATVCAQCGVGAKTYDLTIGTSYNDNGNVKALQATVSPISISKTSYVDLARFEVAINKSTVSSGESFKIATVLGGTGITFGGTQATLELACDSVLTGYTCGVQNTLALAQSGNGTYAELQGVTTISLSNTSYFFPRTATFIVRVKDAQGNVRQEKTISVVVNGTNW